MRSQHLMGKSSVPDIALGSVGQNKSDNVTSLSSMAPFASRSHQKLRSLVQEPHHHPGATALHSWPMALPASVHLLCLPASKATLTPEHPICLPSGPEELPAFCFAPQLNCDHPKSPAAHHPAPTGAGYGGDTDKHLIHRLQQAPWEEAPCFLFF